MARIVCDTCSLFSFCTISGFQIEHSLTSRCRLLLSDSNRHFMPRSKILFTVPRPRLIFWKTTIQESRLLLPATISKDWLNGRRFLAALQIIYVRRLDLLCRHQFRHHVSVLAQIQYDERWNVKYSTIFNSDLVRQYVAGCGPQYGVIGTRLAGREVLMR